MGGIIGRNRSPVKLTSKLVSERSTLEKIGPDEKPQTIPKRFKPIRTIGTGSYSTVKVAIDSQTGLPVVLKIMDKVHIIRKGQIDHVNNERYVLSKVHNPFIVQFHSSLQTLTHLYLVLEFVQGGEMFRYLEIRNTLREDEVKFYAAELVSALAYLHGIKAIYRDLKPENVLIAASGHIKLADFGFAKILKSGDRTRTLCGTPEYLAPEIVDRAGHGVEADWWQLGIMMYEMLFACTPFRDSDPYQLYENILSQKPEFPNCSESVKAVIAGLLEKEPGKRLGKDTIQMQSFFADIDWEAVAALRLSPPYLPRLADSVDTNHFDAYCEQQELPPAVLIDVFPEF